MYKSSGIRWTNKQKAELTRQVKRFNAKIEREAKKNANLTPFLPQKLSVKELKATIKSVQDLKLISARVDRAFKPKALEPIITKQGVMTTAFQIKELELGVKRINKARQKELEKADPSTYKGTMGSVKDNNLKPKKFEPDKITKHDWEKFVESVEKQSRASYTAEKKKAYKENYLKAILDNLGEAGYELYNYIKKIGYETLYDAYYDDPVLQINFIYDPQQSAFIAQEALYRWRDYTGIPIDGDV